jgi:ATP-binding cassette subfamily B protein
MPLPILAAVIYFVNTIIHKKSEGLQTTLASLTSNAQQSYSGIRVIKSFVQEKAMLNFFEENSQKYKQEAVNLAKVEALYFPSMGLFIGLSTLLTIMIGGLHYIRGTGDVGLDTIVEFIIYINMLTFPVSAIGWTASMIQRASASQKRLNEFLHTEPKIKDAFDTTEISLNGNIFFDDVDFTYPHTGIHALKKFTLKVNAGQKIAIVGKTGSGKSTVAQLLLRMYDASSGSIYLDDIDIKSIELKNLREQISYVPQDGFLFSDTIRNNILFGADDSSDADIHMVSEFAVVDKEIAGFPAQYKTMVGERGVTLSGGQKQRISIARALMKDAAVLILDDSLSAVDAKTEKEILKNLQQYLKGKTSIFITHRISTLIEFDKIVVLDDGYIVEEGTHAELMEIGGMYAEMYERQLRRDGN